MQGVHRLPACNTRLHAHKNRRCNITYRKLRGSQCRQVKLRLFCARDVTTVHCSSRGSGASFFSGKQPSRGSRFVEEHLSRQSRSRAVSTQTTAGRCFSSMRQCISAKLHPYGSRRSARSSGMTRMHARPYGTSTQSACLNELMGTPGQAFDGLHNVPWIFRLPEKKSVLLRHMEQPALSLTAAELMFSRHSIVTCSGRWASSRARYQSCCRAEPLPAGPRCRPCRRPPPPSPCTCAPSAAGKLLPHCWR